jgi:hypothetical protein
MTPRIRLQSFSETPAIWTAMIAVRRKSWSVNASGRGLSCFVAFACRSSLNRFDFILRPAHETLVQGEIFFRPTTFELVGVFSQHVTRRFETQYAITQATGISQSILNRFINDKRGIRRDEVGDRMA